MPGVVLALPASANSGNLHSGVDIDVEEVHVCFFMPSLSINRMKPRFQKAGMLFIVLHLILTH